MFSHIVESGLCKCLRCIQMKYMQVLKEQSEKVDIAN